MSHLTERIESLKATILNYQILISDLEDELYELEAQLEEELSDED